MTTKNRIIVEQRCVLELDEDEARILVSLCSYDLCAIIRKYVTETHSADDLTRLFSSMRKELGAFVENADKVRAVLKDQKNRGASCE